MSAAPLGEMRVLSPVPHPTTNFAPIWIMELLGYASEEGLDLSIELAGSPKNAAEGVISGRGDTTFINVVFTLMARDQGVPLRPYYAFVRTQNRAFSVPADSPIRAIQDLHGSTIGLHYDDPQLFEFARAALIGAGIDPERDVSFKTLPGTPLDAPRMAAAIRDNEVQAIWQLDVLAGLMEAEGLPLRLLPCDLIDPLTPSSCFNALDDNLRSRPDAYGAFGRALAKSTLFCLLHPERAIELMWEGYPDAGPKPGQNSERAYSGELAALKTRLAGHRIESAPDPRWGAISESEMIAWQEFLIQTGAIREKRKPSVYYSNTLVEAFNAFDQDEVISRARVSNS